MNIPKVTELGLGEFLGWDFQPKNPDGMVLKDGANWTICSLQTHAQGYLFEQAPALYECLREAVLESCHDCQDTDIEHCRGKCFVAKWRDILAKASVKGRAYGA